MQSTLRFATEGLLWRESESTRGLG